MTASWTQSNFLGGQWGIESQGRIDDPDYRKALAACVNMLPQEGGCVTRRPGFRMCGPTLNGLFGITYSWPIVGANTYDLEVVVAADGSSALRVWSGDQPMVDSVLTISAISTDSPAEVTLPSAVSWETGNTVVIAPSTGTLTGTTQWAPIFNRQMTVTVIDSTHITLTDAITGDAISGAGWAGLSMPTLYIGRVTQFGMPTTNQDNLLSSCGFQALIGGVQMFIICQPGTPPYAVTVTALPTSTTWPTFSVALFPFTAGPYQALNSLFTGTASAASGSITFTSTGSLPNGGSGFQSTDVSRSIRLFSIPPAYNGSTTYASGDAVYWLNVSYVSLISSNTGNQPDISPTDWGVQPELTYWADAEITGVSSTSVITVNLSAFGDYTLPPENGLTISNFTLGLYTATGNIWPACGTFHEGRLWLSGAILNQIDGSESQLLTFRPTDLNGNVNDDNAIQAPLLSPDANAIYWILPDQQGLIIGTQTEEWLVTATTQNDPLTPTNFQAHRATKYGSFLNVQPTYAGMAIIFPTKNPRDVFEYLADVFSGKFTGLPLNGRAKSVTGFVSQVTYNGTPEPIVWGRTFGSGLVGCTYRRVSRFVNEPPRFYGWHTHALSGIAPNIISMSATIIPQANSSAFLDSLAVTAATQPQGTSGNSGVFYRLLMQSIYDPNFSSELTWCLDGAVSGLFANLGTAQPNVFVGMSAVEDGTNMYFSGLWYQGPSVRVYLGGLDFGDVSVVNGAITVPYASDPNGIGTRAYLLTQCLENGVFANGACAVQGLGLLPTIVGASYTSTITTLRGDTQEQARTPNGPAPGLLRMMDQSSALIGYGVNSAATVGFDGQPAYPLVLRQYINGPALPVNVPFSGVWRDTVDDDWTYDGQMTISISGPTPFQLLSLTPYQDTSEG